MRTGRNLPNKGRIDDRTREGSILWKAGHRMAEFGNKGHCLCYASTVAYVCLPVDFMKTAKYSRYINRPYQYQLFSASPPHK